MKRSAICTLLLALAVGPALPVTAQSPRPDTSSAASAGELTSRDANFLVQAASRAEEQLELGRLVSERGSSEAVKEFGQRMVADYGRAKEELAQLATRKGLVLPAGIGREQTVTIARLSRLSGPEFDRAYLQMRQDYDRDVTEAWRRANDAQDADLKAWAAKTLPMIEEHQRQVSEMLPSVGGREDTSASPKSPAPASSTK
jgi:putative membrane protein